MKRAARIVNQIAKRCGRRTSVTTWVAMYQLLLSLGHA